MDDVLNADPVLQVTDIPTTEREKHESDVQRPTAILDDVYNTGSEMLVTNIPIIEQDNNDSHVHQQIASPDNVDNIDETDVELLQNINILLGFSASYVHILRTDCN